MKTITTISVVKQGELIPFDGQILEGLAQVDESAQTGVSKPVLLEAPGYVIAGTLVVDGWLKIEGLSEEQVRGSKNKVKPDGPPPSRHIDETEPGRTEIPVKQTGLRRKNQGPRIRIILFLAPTIVILFVALGYVATHSTAAMLVSGIVGLMACAYQGWSA